MEHRPGIGLDSYDRLFPNQDTLPHNGFGNLIALPPRGRLESRATVSFLIKNSPRFRTNGAFSQVSAGSRPPERKELSVKPNKRGHLGVRLAPRDEDEDELHGSPHRHAAERNHPLPNRFRRDLNSFSAIKSIYQRRAGAGLRIDRPVGGFPKSGILPSSGDASFDLRNPRIVGCAEDLPPTPCPSTRLP